MRLPFRFVDCVGASALIAYGPGMGVAMAEPLPPDGDASYYVAAQEAASSAPTLPVVRRGRYTLVELAPEPAQRDLTRQVIEVSIPAALDATVGDGLRHVLLRSGYRLCDAADASPLYALPLPAAHLRLGPMTLRDALLTIAGPAWDLSIDELARMVCFARHVAMPAESARPSSAAASEVSAEPGSAASDAREVRP
jgi:type IV pili sensor histidine kinase/response regulator